MLKEVEARKDTLIERVFSNKFGNLCRMCHQAERRPAHAICAGCEDRLVKLVTESQEA